MDLLAPRTILYLGLSWSRDRCRVERESCSLFVFVLRFRYFRMAHTTHHHTTTPPHHHTTTPPHHHSTTAPQHHTTTPPHHHTTTPPHHHTTTPPHHYTYTTTTLHHYNTTPLQHHHILHIACLKICFDDRSLGWLSGFLRIISDTEITIWYVTSHLFGNLMVSC